MGFEPVANGIARISLEWAAREDEYGLWLQSVFEHLPSMRILV